jgi:hypothetical protein
VTPIEVKQAITRILVSDDKAKVLLAIFGSTENMQLQIVNHVESFVDAIINVTIDFITPIIELRGELPDSEIMAKLLDNSFDDLIKYQEKSVSLSQEKIQIFMEYINIVSKHSPIAVDYFRHSLSCFLAGLHNAGRKYLTLSILEALNNVALLKEAIGEADASEVKSKTASNAAKKGNTKRWETKEKTRLYAIELYRNKNYRNANQAAEDITEEVFKYGKEIGFHFTGIFQANKTIHKWLLADSK